MNASDPPVYIFLAIIGLPFAIAIAFQIYWDDGPWSGHLGDAPAARKRGLSTAVFMALVLPPSLAGMGIGVYLLVRGIQEQQQRNELAPQQTAGASAPTSGVSIASVYEIRCRGGARDAFRSEQLTGVTRTEPSKEVRIVPMSLRFTPSETAAGADGAGLTPGTCDWLDRPLNEPEPRVILFEVSGIRTTDPPHTILPVPGSFPDDEHFSDPTRYWSFRVINFNAGYLQATSHGRWSPPAKADTERQVAPPALEGGEIVQRFVCERSYTNFAWGYQHRGIYVGREGGVHRFSVETVALPRPPQRPDLSEAEMEAKYGPGSTLVRTVPREELLAMFRLIPAAARGRYSTRVPAGADRGALTSACYLFDAADRRYREVELDVKGDWEYRNLAPEAQTLAAWLASLDRPLEKK